MLPTPIIRVSRRTLSNILGTHKIGGPCMCCLAFYEHNLLKSYAENYKSKSTMPKFARARAGEEGIRRDSCISSLINARSID